MILETNNFGNIILSYWILYPILHFVLSKFNYNIGMSYKLFFSFSTRVLILVDLIGAIYRILNNMDPDSMGFAYGCHFYAFTSNQKSS